ncbi:MAG: FAD-dependent thymidylate synthase [Chloroflexi bacterium]|nr:FAD-dependent thymidylate synthase [Chloroflexota bacterium]
MRVSLVRYTPDPELTVASAARLCYSEISAIEIAEKLSESQVDRLLQQVIASGHHSVLEHASFTFAIDGISRAASHQLVRHRLASYSQQSQRWVRYRSPEFVCPPTIIADAEARKLFDQALQTAFERYLKLLEAGVPAEDARYVLPNATTTRLVMTMNARELMHTCSIRLCLRAQWEIREMFQRIKEEVNAVAPRIGAALQIKCIKLGYCDEKETCGIRPLKEDVIG